MDTAYTPRLPRQLKWYDYVMLTIGFALLLGLDFVFNIWIHIIASVSGGRHISDFYYPWFFVAAHLGLLILIGIGIGKSWSRVRLGGILLVAVPTWIVVSYLFLGFAKSKTNATWETHSVSAGNAPVCGQWDVTKASRPLSSGWWYSTRPSGIGVASPTDVWVIGNEPVGSPWGPPHASSFLLHWDGKEWSEQDLPNNPFDPVTHEDLKAITSRSPHDVWLEGDTTDSKSFHHTTYHWDGTRWTMQPSDIQGTCDLSALDIHDPTDMWVVRTCTANGAKDVVPAHFDSSTNAWTEALVGNDVTAPLDAVTAISAVTARDVWMVGSQRSRGPIISYWDGSHWTLTLPPENSPGAKGFNYVAALGPGDVWVVGYLYDGKHAGLALHWDGVKWTDAPLPAAPGNVALTKVVARSPQDVWASGDVMDPEADKTNVYHPWLVHWDGTKWSKVDTPAVNGPGSGGFTDIDVSPNGDLWATAWIEANDPDRYDRKDGLLFHFVPSACGKQ